MTFDQKNKNTVHTSGNTNAYMKFMSLWSGYVLRFKKMNIFDDFWFLTGSDPLMTFDPETVDTPKTLVGSNACVLMTTLCYVICKNSDFLNIFSFQTGNDPLNDL